MAISHLFAGSLCTNYLELRASSAKRAAFYVKNEQLDKACVELNKTEYYLMQAYGECDDIKDFKTSIDNIKNLKELCYCK